MTQETGAGGARTTPGRPGRLVLVGVGMGVVTLTVGLVGSRALGAAVFALWGVLALGMSHWERLRGARRPGPRTRTAPLWVLSFAGYVIAVAAGTENTGDLGYWLPAALLVPLPVLAAALRERRG